VDADAVQLLRTAYTHRVPLLETVALELDGLARVGLETYAHDHIDRIGFRVKASRALLTRW